MQDRYSRQNKTPDTPPKKDDCGCTVDCTENDTATQKVINAERKMYCDDLVITASEVYKWEENYFGQKELKRKRRCLFIWTEKNYQVFRNLEISTGTSLVQFNESIKDSTTGFLDANKKLAKILKDDILKKIKDLKKAVYELRDAASDLKHCTDEGCNCTQWGILTDDWSKCKEKKETKRPPECDDMKDKFKKLFCIPKAMATDVDSLFKASADVVGIQIFSNVSTLESLQKTLYASITAFDKHLQDTMKKNQDEVKRAQEEFVKTVQEFSKSKAILYTKRTEFSGAFETAATFCCPHCGCIEKDHECEPRLGRCKERICDICEEVKETFCGCATDTTEAS